MGPSKQSQVRSWSKRLRTVMSAGCGYASATKSASKRGWNVGALLRTGCLTGQMAGYGGSTRFVGQWGVRLSGGVSVSGAAVEHADAVVVGVGVAEALAFDGFDDPVDAFGGPVGEPLVEVGEQAPEFGVAAFGEAFVGGDE